MQMAEMNKLKEVVKVHNTRKEADSPLDVVAQIKEEIT